MSTKYPPWFDAFTESFRDFTYYPVTTWSRLLNITPSVSLFTYNAGDQEVEQEVLDHVGSYGSQLSTILKMLDVLRQQVAPSGFDKTDQLAVDEFNELFRKSRAAVAKHKGELGITDEDRVAAYLRKAGNGEFGEEIFNELKEIFTHPTGRNGGTKRKPEAVGSGT